ncbi:MAG: AAA family ATPase, partial [Microbacteriaceae bacterium]|nr:AAA family ATPase [Microbacteriaceae bacterium]
EEVNARIALESSRQKAHSASESLALLHARLREQEAARVQELARASARVARAQRAKEVLTILPGALEVATAAVAQSAQALVDAEAKRQVETAELIELRTEESQARERLAAITDSVHNLEMHMYEKKLQRTTLLERVSEELGLDEATLLAEYGPDVPIPAVDEDDAASPGDTVYVRAEQESRLKQAQRKLDQLGRVNPLALEEFNALEQRHTFLRDQLVDLHKARKDLESIMAELDDTMQTIFHEAFEDTKKAFDEVLPILFPGGSGSLRLSEGEDLLSTGIEVAVKPAGKKIERLSLLSGGERSLAAVALLIAIFKARPSPFYILDEVEAALDDSNLGRLLSVIESLRESSQLIVITHQKRTMEIADALYGVSMRKDGVSAVVGQRVKEAQALAS